MLVVCPAERSAFDGSNKVENRCDNICKASQPEILLRSLVGVQIKASTIVYGIQNKNCLVLLMRSAKEKTFTRSSEFDYYTRLAGQYVMSNSIP